jgi:pilus assembly protein Flp/PilA
VGDIWRVQFMLSIHAALAPLIRRVSREQRGQTMTEYGILIALVVVGVVVAATVFGSSISSLFSSNAQHL